MKWPNNKDFAFTIIDDTDGGFIHNTKPIYDLLIKLEIKTTKTVWVYPSRDRFTGSYLLDKKYLEFVQNLQANGFEIALHNVGSGQFSRPEIHDGLIIFKELIGHYPNIQINHSANRDNIYWGKNRFVFPVNILFGLNSKLKSFGHVKDSELFWGDLNQQHIKYMRNHCFNGINTIKNDPHMPYKVKHKPFVNYFFSSSDGDTVEEFTNLISKRNVDKLVKQGGLCVIYTHFSQGFVDEDGLVNEDFKQKLKYLASKNGWFAPASEIFDYMIKNRQTNNEYISKWQHFKLNIKWLRDRIKKKIKFKR